jgi:hypothetical protein
MACDLLAVYTKKKNTKQKKKKNTKQKNTKQKQRQTRMLLLLLMQSRLKKMWLRMRTRRQSWAHGAKVCQRTQTAAMRGSMKLCSVG